ncbi:hypothetical protein Tco_1516099 [Tanacetum coccineum]
MAAVEVPHTLEYRSGQLKATPVLETREEINAANLDQRLKSLIMSVLPDDQMNFVINCLTVKSTWDDLILYHKGPSEVKESSVVDLKLCYNTFKFKEDEKEVSSDDNKMVEVKVLMTLAEENDAISKEGAKNGEWVKISMIKCISEQISSQKKRIIGVDKLIEDPSSSRQKDLVFVKSSADDTKVSIPGVERPWLSEAEGFILPNHDTGRILPAESQRNTTDPSVDVTESSATDYDSSDESSVYSTPLPPLKKLDDVEPISGPKTIKSILRSKSTFKAETLKDVIINEPSSSPAKDNKSSSASKVNSAPTGKLKSVKIKDAPPLAIVMKELNDLKL